MKKIWLIGLIVLMVGLWSNSSFSEIPTLPNNELKRPSEFEKIFNYGLQLNKNIKEGPVRKEFETEHYTRECIKAVGVWVEEVRLE